MSRSWPDEEGGDIPSGGHRMCDKGLRMSDCTKLRVGDLLALDTVSLHQLHQMVPMLLLLQVQVWPSWSLPERHLKAGGPCMGES